MSELGGVGFEAGTGDWKMTFTYGAFPLVRDGTGRFGCVSITTEYHMVPPQRGRGRHNTAARNCRDVHRAKPRTKPEDQNNNNNNISNTAK